MDWEWEVETMKESAVSVEKNLPFFLFFPSNIVYNSRVNRFLPSEALRFDNVIKEKKKTFQE